jgi:hypothetical protein
MASRNAADTLSRPAEWWWIFDPRYSLRARAALLAGGGMLVFTLLLTSMAGAVFRRALERQLGGQFETSAFQVGDKLDRAIYERSRTLLLAAGMAGLRDATTPPAERRRLLETIQESSPDFAWIGFADATGRVVAGTSRLFEDTNVGTRAWFLGGRERPFFGSLLERPDLAREIPNSDDPETGKRFLDLAVPLTDAAGRFVGVLAAHLRWQWAQDVQRSVIAEAGRPGQITVTVYSANREVLLDSGASSWAQPPEPPASIDARRQRGIVVEDTPEGTRFLTGFSRSRGFRDYRGIGWLTLVRQPAATAFAPVEHLQRAISLRGVALSMVAAVAAWVIAGRFTRRLMSVTAAADRIREGDVLTVLPPPTGTGEMDRMCGALGNLVEDLRAKNGLQPHEAPTSHSESSESSRP